MNASYERSLSRRDFLTRSGIAAASVVTGGIRTAPVVASARPPEDWVAVRARFRLRRDYLHFAAPVLASHPDVVAAAIADHRRALDADTKRYLYANETRLDDQVRGLAATYLDADADDVALTDSTTMGLGTVYTGLDLRAGDEILTTEHDFYATHQALRFCADRTGARIRKVTLYPEASPQDATCDGIVDSLIRGVTSRTRLVAVTWVHSSSGVKLPLADIAAAIQERGRQTGDPILLSVDGVHGFGVESEPVARLGCDLFISGCHKWLFGPRGTGLVWGSADGWNMVRSTIPSFDGRAYSAWLEGRGSSQVPAGPWMTPGGFHSFEHRWALAEAFRFHDQIGADAIANRTHALAAQLKEGLADIDGITVHTPAAAHLSSGIVCFSVDGIPSELIVDALETKLHVLASVTPYRQAFVRFMPSLVNAPDEIEEALLALRTLTTGR